MLDTSLSVPSIVINAPLFDLIVAFAIVLLFDGIGYYRRALLRCQGVPPGVAGCSVGKGKLGSVSHHAAIFHLLPEVARG